jgi:hypothetical protein
MLKVKLTLEHFTVCKSKLKANIVSPNEAIAPAACHCNASVAAIATGNTSEPPLYSFVGKSSPSRTSKYSRNEK